MLINNRKEIIHGDIFKSELDLYLICVYVSCKRNINSNLKCKYLLLSLNQFGIANYELITDKPRSSTRILNKLKQSIVKFEYIQNISYSSKDLWSEIFKFKGE